MAIVALDISTNEACIKPGPQIFLDLNMEIKNEWQLVTDKENLFAIRVKASHTGDDGQCYSVDFEWLDVESMEMDSEETFHYQKKDEPSDTTTDPDEARRKCKGHIKWDECINMTWYPDEDGYAHYCGIPIKEFSLFFETLKELAQNILGESACFS